MSRLARWCYAHRSVVLVSWIIAVLALAGVKGAVGTAYSSSFGVGGSGSARALQLLRDVAPRSAGDVDTVVWQVKTGSVRDPAVQNQVASLLGDIGGVASVTSVSSPYESQGARQVSADGRSAYATITFDQQANSLPLGDLSKVVRLVKQKHVAGLELAVGGQAIERSERTPPATTAAIGVAAAALVLFLAFGSLLATLLPIATALVAILGGLSVVGLLSHVLSIGSFSPTLGALIGLGVGIDYALFIVTRYRSGLRQGLTPQQATVRALDTSGRAVLFAGGTVCVALLGLLVLGISFLSGAGIAAVVVVVFTVLAAVTLLPALLSFLGIRVLRRRDRPTLSDATTLPADAGFWVRWAANVQRWPAALAIGALVVMGVLAVPASSLTLGSSDEGNDPSTSTTRVAYDLLAEGFGPGFNGPLQLVVQAGSAPDQASLNRLVTAVQSTPGVARVERGPAVGAVSSIEVIPTTPPESAATSRLLSHLRDVVIPRATAGTGIRAYIGGTTAIFADFAAAIAAKFALFLFVVVGLGFVLLLLAFRSVVIPALAAAMNLLVTASALGVLVAVFQWGWLGTWLGRPGPIDAFLPVMMVAILFGLSMDYQVFLVSRMHEEWLHSRRNSLAVRIGQAETGRVITAAGTIMILVFLSFVFGGLRVIAEFGLGLAASVLLDAFVVRSVLVPAAMHLLGDVNWWLPGSVDARLPRLSLEVVEPEGVELPADAYRVMGDSR